MAKYTTEYSNMLVGHFYDDLSFSKKDFIIDDPKEKTEKGNLFLEKYWISNKEFESYWKTLLEEIFYNSKSFPDIIYKNTDFNFFFDIGGVMFLEKDFLKLQQFLISVGEKYFAIISESNDVHLKFPIDITWEELRSGSFVSSFLFDSPNNVYFLVGEKGLWGRYLNNDYYDDVFDKAGTPIDLIGIKADLATKFKENFPFDKNLSDHLTKIRPILPNYYFEKLIYTP